ncbi:biotin synthase BioB, partial [Abyssisolibacter fermentans]|uniref:biotin synthase BioB n=1 Tax=Abyssisolibacter fermentans TaxID=1766203 RepID=UPI00082C6C48
MYKLIKDIENRILNGGSISYEESLQLINTSNDNIEHLFNSADKIRQAYMGNKADLCTIVNAKSGKCSENCKYCAQSIYYNTGVHEYKLLSYDNILEKALYVQNKGAHRISLVTSGRGVADEDLKELVEIYKRLKIDTDLKICASHGIITYEQALLLKSSGVDMYHHNLETGYKYYKNICTTHNYDDRIRTIDNLQKAGITVCSGGIIGMDETLIDRIDMAFELRRLN